VVQGNGVLLDTKNGKGRSVLSAGKQFGFKKKKCETLVVRYTDFIKLVRFFHVRVMYPGVSSELYK